MKKEKSLIFLQQKVNIKDHSRSSSQKPTLSPQVNHAQSITRICGAYGLPLIDTHTSSVQYKLILYCLHHRPPHPSIHCNARSAGRRRSKCCHLPSSSSCTASRVIVTFRLVRAIDNCHAGHPSSVPRSPFHCIQCHHVLFPCSLITSSPATTITVPLIVHPMPLSGAAVAPISIN